MVDKLLQLFCITESDNTSLSPTGTSRTYISDEKYQLFIETVIRYAVVCDAKFSLWALQNCV